MSNSCLSAYVWCFRTTSGRKWNFSWYCWQYDEYCGDFSTLFSQPLCFVIFASCYSISFCPAPEWISLIKSVSLCEAAQTNRAVSKVFTLFVGEC